MFPEPKVTIGLPPPFEPDFRNKILFIEDTMITLDTERLCVRQFLLSDWEVLNVFLSDPEVIRYMHFRAWTEEKRRKWFVWCVQNGEEPNSDAFNWAITLKTSGELIGWLGIGGASQPTVERERDFGYALSRQSWGQGYMSEALTAVLRFEFDVLKTPRIYGECDLANMASGRVMEKAGMRYEGIFLDADSDECHRYALSLHEFDQRGSLL